jgi:hypothetical protein
MLMKKGTLIWAILGCALLAFAVAECDMSGSSSSALDNTCDASADATCPVVTPPPTPSGGW